MLRSNGQVRDEKANTSTKQSNPIKHQDGISGRRPAFAEQKQLTRRTQHVGSEFVELTPIVP